MERHIRVVENRIFRPGSEANPPPAPRGCVYLFLNQGYTVAALGATRGARTTICGHAVGTWRALCS